MARGYVGRDQMAIVQTTYEYIGSEFYDPTEFSDFLKFNFETAKDTKTYQKHIPDIAKLAVQFAQDLVISNGTYKTGRLHDSIQWAPTSEGFTLFANARDNHGSAYAGHIEYGFVGRDGMPHGPWPFLRPAMRMAAEASKGVLADEAAMNVLYGHAGALSFGRANIKHLLNKEGARNRSAYVKQTTREFNPNKDTKRWTGAKHGIDHMGRLANDKTQQGRDLYDSFKSNYGTKMDRWDYQRGAL